MRSGKWVALGAMVALCIVAGPAFAWGDEGHEIVGLIAQHYLDPGVATKIKTLLATDATGLTSNKNIDMEATWADHYREHSSANFPALRGSRDLCISLCTPATTTMRVVTMRR